MEILITPQFHEKHEFKFAALSKSIAYPVDPWFQLGGFPLTIGLIFALIAILVSAMGVLGLSLMVAQRRFKEIGIRKVLGATVSNIISLLSIDFIRLVLIGFALAIPISWYIMSKWLNDFAYKIDIGVGVFAIAASLVLVITIIITSWQSIKASLMNPVNSLKSE